MSDSSKKGRKTSSRSAVKKTTEDRSSYFKQLPVLKRDELKEFSILARKQREQYKKVLNKYLKKSV